jgi:hypothetical protein
MIDCSMRKSVLRILFRIRLIRTFLGLLDLDPDPLVRGMDPVPDSSIIKQKLISTVFFTSFRLFIFK